MQEQRYLDAAQRMGLFSHGASAGVVYWQPPGLKLYEKLRQFIRAAHEERDYQEVKSPAIVNLEVFEKSGHLAKYRDNLFCLNQENGPELDRQGYALRPMSCPNHIVLYQSARRSYRELPYRLFEFGEVFRNESSGSLQSLFRMRQFCQDDSHVFCAEHAMVDSIKSFLDMAQRVYRQLGFSDIGFAISLRPSERFGDDALWDRAENALREACRQQGLAWEELPGEGAFYGPKIELQVRDKLGRRWQLGTLQLDYVLPRRFGLSYLDAGNQEAVPVLLHHAVLGSLERMIGILLEIHGVALPLFLQPHEAVVVPVSAKAQAYAGSLYQLLRQRWKHALVDLSDEPLGAKLRYWKQRGVPYVLVVGEKEAQQHVESGLWPAALNNQPLNVAVWLAEGPG